MNIGITAQAQYADYRIYAIRRLHALNNGSVSTVYANVERSRTEVGDIAARQGAHLMRWLR